MAIIKFKNIKSNLQHVIDYGKNGDKTENGALVSSINCGVETAYEEMALTKKFYHKEDKILGYHIIQSFDGFETSPANANQIGKQLAEEMWGDKYQVVICTHVNKQNVHNHIILNSVSSDFKLALKAKGYSNIKDNGKYFSLKTPYYSRNVRINKVFGDDYSVQGIKERIYGYRKVETMQFANYNKKYYKKIYKGPKIDWKLYKRNRFYAWYVAALYILGILPAKVVVQEVTVQDYKVRNKTKMIFEELNFINQSHSKSIEDIKIHKKEIEDKLPVLKGERENLWIKYKKKNLILW